MPNQELYERVKGMDLKKLVSSIYGQLKLRMELDQGDILPTGIFKVKEWFRWFDIASDFRGRTFEQYQKTHEDEAQVTLGYLEKALNDYGVTLSI